MLVYNIASRKKLKRALERSHSLPRVASLSEFRFRRALRSRCFESQHDLLRSDERVHAAGVDVEAREVTRGIPAIEALGMVRVVRAAPAPRLPRRREPERAALPKHCAQRRPAQRGDGIVRQRTRLASGDAIRRAVPLPLEREDFYILNYNI